MRVWIVCVGEPIPTDPGTPRLLRAGLLARELVERGHEVVWWNSTVDHTAKTLRADRSTRLDVGPGYRIWLLHGGLYRRNVSPARLLNHWRIAKEFERLAPTEPPPDIVLACMPTIELTHAAVLYASRRGIPSVVDVRDFWPDIWEEASPAQLQWIARAALSPYRNMVRATFRLATAVTGCSRGAVDWGLELAERRAGPWDVEFYHGAPVSARPLAPSGAEHLEARRREKLRVIYSGNIGVRTGVVEFLIRFLSLPMPIRERIDVLICGTGDNLERAKMAAGAAPDVIFRGWLDRDQLYEELFAADVGLLPYPRDDDRLRLVPNKLCEYLACGLPVLTSLEGEVADLLRAEGIGRVYDPASPESLGRALRAFLDVNEYAAMRAAADGCRHRFRADAVYPRFAEHLERIASATQAPNAASPTAIRSSAVPARFPNTSPAARTFGNES